MNTDDLVAQLHDRDQQLSSERARADRAEAKCAEMKYVLESFCDYGFEKTLQHALSSDCGKGWRSPEEYAALEAKLVEEQKESQRAWGRNNSLESQLAIVLARGKGFIPATLLDKTIEVLEKVESTEHGYTKFCTCCSCTAFRCELARLKAVREEASRE